MGHNKYQHAVDHAEYIINNLMDPKANLTPFNTSIDLVYFILKGINKKNNIDREMKKILNNIEKRVLEVKEKNGQRRNKKGVSKQEYCKRKIPFNRMLMVYHNRHLDASKSVHPHFHFLFDKHSRMGIGFTYLRQVLREEAQKIGVRFNFMEKSQSIGINKGQMRSVERLGWFLNQGDMNKISSYFLNDNSLQNNLDWLVQHYKHTKNLSFFIKTISIVNQRLSELDINYIYENINLKEDIFFFLTREQKEILDLLQKSEQVDIDLNTVLGREIYKFSHGFPSDVVDILCERFDLPDIDKDTFNIVNTEGDMENEMEYKRSNFKDLIIEDLKTAISLSSTEREIKNILTDSNAYLKVSTKTHSNGNGKRNKVGFNIVTGKNAKKYISLQELDLTWAQISAILEVNKKSTNKRQLFNSKMDQYEPKAKKVEEEFDRYLHKKKTLLRLSVKDKLPYIENTQQKHKLTDKFDDIQRSDMYDITRYSNKHETIVSYEKSIWLKKCLTMTSSVSSMLDIAELRGMNLNAILIDGDDAYVKSAQRQIHERTSKKPNKKNISSIKL